MNIAKLFFCLIVILFISCATEIVSEEICINGECKPNNSGSSIVLAECPYYDPSTHFCDSRNYKIYKYAIIGSQTWMAENLNYATSSGSACYNNQNRYCDVYGRLYNWATAMKSCPNGWHLPSAAELDELMDFAALPGGFGYSDGSFGGVGNYGYWWSSSDINANHAYFKSIIFYVDGAYIDTRNKANFYSVRCLQ